MPCSKITSKVTGFIHLFALIITFVGMGFQLAAVANDQPYAIWLPVSLSLMMLLRIPNQICVALESPDGWFSVIGSVIGLLGYIALTIVTFNKSKGEEPNQPLHIHTPTPLLNAQQKSFI